MDGRYTGRVKTSKRTPCVGICSTTYGDLVCRGCKRFAHEIVQWNGYDEMQRDTVWLRLRAIRSEVFIQHLRVADTSVYDRACTAAGLMQVPTDERMYALLTQLAAQGSQLQPAGLSSVDDGSHAAALETDALSLIKTLDAEVYRRSMAHYERNFKVPI